LVSSEYTYLSFIADPSLPLGEPHTPYNATRCKLTHKINAKGFANDDEVSDGIEYIETIEIDV
jgi:hypothetical protein